MKRLGFLPQAREQMYEHLLRVLSVHEGHRHAAAYQVLGDYSSIYFVRDQSGRIKIGRALRARARLAELQVGNAEQLDLVLAIPGGSRLEAALHRTFESAHIRGEWFCATPALLDLIQLLLSLKAPRDA